MSKIIKAFEITGEYRLDDVNIESVNKEKNYSNCKDNSNHNKITETINVDEDINDKLDQAQDEAEKIIATASKKAEKIIKKAENKASKIQESAYEEGYKQGKNEGKKQAYNEELEQIQQNIVNMNKQLTKVKKDLLEEKRELPQTVINLAVQIASRIVNVNLNINPELINDIIVDILGSVGSNYENIIVKVNPDLLQHINEFETTSLLTNSDLQFKGDNTLEYGDCVLETEFGGKDGTVANKLKLLEEKLYKEVSRNES